MSWIPQFVKGDRDRTPMHAEAANEIVNGINVLLNLALSPDWVGKLSMGDANTILDLQNLVDYIDALIPAPPTSGGYAFVAENGTKEWTQGIVLGDTSTVNAFLGLGSDSTWKLTLTDGTDSCGLHPNYLELNNQNVFLGKGSTGILLGITDGDHACGLHGSYLDFDSSKAFFGFTGSTYKLTISDGDNGVGLEAGKLAFSNGSGNGGVYIGTSGARFEASNVTLENGEGHGFFVNEASLVSNSCTVGSDGGFYVGNASLVSDSCTVGSGGGFYVGSTSLTSSQLTVSSVSCDSMDASGSCSVGGNLDASSISTDSLTVNGTTYSPHDIRYVDDSGNIHTVTVLSTEPQSSGTLESCDS